MNKTLIVVVLAVALGAGGWFSFQQYQARQARQAEQARVAVAKARADEDERARGAAEQARVVDEAARARAQQAAIAALRLDVETQLKAMKVSSLSPGQPGMVIIDKKPYEEGGMLPPTAGGRQARITAVREDGVLLGCEGQGFRLAAPAVPGLKAEGRR